MRTVLITAAASLLGCLAAHGADLPKGAALPLASSATCTSSAPWAHTAYATDDDAECCYANSHCSQYISTQRVVRAPRRSGRT